ncbi:ABC-three component system protein [Streptomyces sp. NPDC058642]|uniref:ABC-three component system protein n=1 Tax=Streptomyces sp. NPDC058642 TaxID=3346572 RepID=UPI00365540E2
MQYEQRMYARLKFLELMAELNETTFEGFFHDLMCVRYPEFLDVRTHGNLGDQGSDGLMLHERKLFACYAPQTVSATEIRSKIRSDVAKALEKRLGQFDVFVFVHNDRRGMHPEIATELSLMQQAHPEISFQQMGSRRLWHECMQLDVASAESVLRCQIPIQPIVHGVGMEDLAPLLKHLRDQRTPADPLMALPEVDPRKLDFNLIHDEARQDLLRGTRQSYLVDEFYAGSLRAVEHDEVARGFRLYYEQVRDEWPDAEDVLWQLEMYVLGNGSVPPRVQRAAWVILAHFFERCDIFEAPPADWSAPRLQVPA